jgi:phage terminase small subunit
MPLNARQQAFIREYPKDFNASAAVLRAGYRTANPAVMGSRLLKSVNIRAALAPTLDPRDEKARASIDKWRDEVNKIAYVKIDDEKITADHKLKSLELLGRADGRFQQESHANAMQAFQINIHIGERE